MRDIRFTRARAGPHPVPLRVRVGEWEGFVDVRGGVAVQFVQVKRRLVARILESRGVRVRPALFRGAGLPGLHALLRRVAQP